MLEESVQTPGLRDVMEWNMQMPFLRKLVVGEHEETVIALLFCWLLVQPKIKEKWVERGCRYKMRSFPEREWYCFI